MNQIAKLYNKNDTGKYTINDNRQLSQSSSSNAKEFEKIVISKVLLSTGEALFEELSDNIGKNILIYDEPTAHLDLYKTAITIESFIRNKAKIRVISSNDYVTLKLIHNYIDTAYNVETGEMCSIKRYCNNMIKKTVNELISNSPFQEINESFYNDLLIH